MARPNDTQCARHPPHDRPLTRLRGPRHCLGLVQALNKFSVPWVKLWDIRNAPLRFLWCFSSSLQVNFWLRWGTAWASHCFCHNAGYYLLTLSPVPCIHTLTCAVSQKSICNLHEQLFTVDKRHFILVHSRTRQLSIHAQHSYFGENANGNGLSASLRNENESAREIYSCANELSTLC